MSSGRQARGVSIKEEEKAWTKGKTRNKFQKCSNGAAKRISFGLILSLLGLLLYGLREMPSNYKFALLFSEYT